MKLLSTALVFIFVYSSAFTSEIKEEIIVGAQRTEIYLPRLHSKRVGVVANHTSLIGQKHIVDTLLSLNINVKKIFCPEHGFRGNIEAGELINNHTDTKTNLPIISIYGNSKKPKPEHLQDIDVVVFDLQDVGVRFYTYISTMHYVMEACAENNIPLIILDRPNPNGFYIDGPVLDSSCTSFVGMHPVPLVHGMTVGEFALMINGEGWLRNSIKCELFVIPCKGYTHDHMYGLPVKPSPNLPNQLSVLLYPSLGFFEGTIVSVGRGTDFPFQVFGYPGYPTKHFKFKPTAKVGASVNPPFKEKVCYGVDLRSYSSQYFADRKSINLDWLIHAYSTHPDKKKFFNSFFKNLAGTTLLRNQIEEGLDSETIRKTWQPGIEKYKQVRKKYLLYADFE